MTYTPASKSDCIRQLNDEFRQSFIGGRVLVTSGIFALPTDTNAVVLERVRTFAGFNAENDPHGEHDFGTIELEGDTYFFKIDYYAPDMQPDSEDPSDLEQTVRVLTIMRAGEYSIPTSKDTPMSNHHPPIILGKTGREPCLPSKEPQRIMLAFLQGLADSSPGRPPGPCSSRQCGLLF